MKKTLVIILLLLFVMSAVFNTGCKTKYDITGTWNFTFYLAGVPMDSVITLTGSISSGTVNNVLLGEIGTYDVNGLLITFSAELKDGLNDVFVVKATGTISNDKQMQGALSYHYTLFPNVTLAGTWKAVR